MPASLAAQLNLDTLRDMRRRRRAPDWSAQFPPCSGKDAVYNCIVMPLTIHAIHQDGTVPTRADKTELSWKTDLVTS